MSLRSSKKDFNAYYREYRKSEQWRTYAREYMRRWRGKNGTDKDNARSRVAYAVKTGEIIKRPCQMCGKRKVEAHHEDYSKPLEIMWLCREHHRQRDIAIGVRET